MERVDFELLDVKSKVKRNNEEQSESVAYRLDAKKEELEHQFKSEFDRERKQHETAENAEGVALVKNTIADQRRKVYQNQSKQR